MEKCCREVLWRRVFWRSAVVKCYEGVVKECCGEVLW